MQQPVDPARPAVSRRGLMLVLSSPSGAGKTSISRQVLAEEAELAISVSVTTRPRRPSEVDGTHYLFLNVERYEALAAGGQLLEHAEVYGNRYGTPRGPVEAALARGQDMLFDVDWQGAQQLRHSMRDDVVSLFILPPSLEELARRLKTRAEDDDATVRYRLNQVAADITHWDAYDYVVVNSDFPQSVAAVRAILAAERLKKARQTGLTGFVDDLRRAAQSGEGR